MLHKYRKRNNNFAGRGIQGIFPQENLTMMQFGEF